MDNFITWTAIAVGVAVFTAFIQERQLSFALFSKRLDVYIDLSSLINTITESVHNNDLPKISSSDDKNNPIPVRSVNSTKLVSLLFSDEIIKISIKLDKLINEIIELLYQKKRFSKYKNSPGRINKIDTVILSNLNLLLAEQKILDAAIGKYLKQATAWESVCMFLAKKKRQITEKLNGLQSRNPLRKRY